MVILDARYDSQRKLYEYRARCDNCNKQYSWYPSMRLAQICAEKHEGICDEQ